MNVAVEEELIRACQVLFGFHLNVGRDFLRYLQPSGVKTAYRKRARETHPDLITDGGEAHGITAASFIEVQKAYEDLSKYLSSRQRGLRFATPPTRHATTSRPRHANPHSSASTKHHRKTTYGQTGGNRSTRKHATHSKNDHHFKKRKVNPESRHHGSLPRRKLLLGQFLYHSGVISWRTMIQSLGWQMMQRPRLGELANHLGWLNDKDIKRISDNRLVLERFGKIAQRLGLLSDFQVKVLLTMQRRRQKRLGDYFVSNGFISAKEVEKLVKKCMEHNASLESAK